MEKYLYKFYLVGGKVVESRRPSPLSYRALHELGFYEYTDKFKKRRMLIMSNVIEVIEFEILEEIKLKENEK